MTWGYESHFTVEHDNTLKKKIDCKDCIYYERSDKSCNKRPVYLPEDGYNSWRNCQYFDLDPSTSNYEIKKNQLDHTHRNCEVKINGSHSSVHEITGNDPAVGKKEIIAGTINDYPKLKAIENIDKLHGLQFNHKSMTEFRQTIAKYYAAITYYNEETFNGLIRKAHGREQDYDYSRLMQRKKQCIENAFNIVQKQLIISFESDDMKAFCVELAKWLYENGMTDAMEKRCEKWFTRYAMAIKNISFALVINEMFNTRNEARSQSKELYLKMVFLDSVAYILAEKKVISIVKYVPDIEFYRKMK